MRILQQLHFGTVTTLLVFCLNWEQSRLALGEQLQISGELMQHKIMCTCLFDGQHNGIGLNLMWFVPLLWSCHAHWEMLSQIGIFLCMCFSRIVSILTHVKLSLITLVADVYVPSRGYIGKFGAILATYLASALLHVSLLA